MLASFRDPREALFRAMSGVPVESIPIVFRARLGERFAPGQDPDALSARMEDYFRRELGS